MKNRSALLSAYICSRLNASRSESLEDDALCVFASFARLRLSVRAADDALS